MTELEQADQLAADVCRIYAQLGSASFVIRTLPDGNCRVIGPQLTPEAVSAMLHYAADTYRAQAPKVGLQ